MFFDEFGEVVFFLVDGGEVVLFFDWVVVVEEVDFDILIVVVGVVDFYLVDEGGVGFVYDDVFGFDFFEYVFVLIVVVGVDDDEILYVIELIVVVYVF